MAGITENRKGNKVTSYRFYIYLGRTSDGKLIKKTTTWKPLSSLTPAKARKEAERAAEQWEEEVKKAQQEEEETERAAAASAPPQPPAPAPKRIGFVILQI